MRALLATATFALVALAAIAPMRAAASSRPWFHRDDGVHTRHYRSHGAAAPGDAQPSAWCGWYMRQLMGVADRSYNLARNWAHWGKPAGGPQIGVIVVWPHHVGKIVGRVNAGWLVLSGNDGHAIRTRARSLAGAIAFRI